MPNLVGVWNAASSSESIRSTLDGQLDRVRTGLTHYAEYRHVVAGFGMALQDHGLLENGDQPARSKDGRLALLLDGEIYNTEELSLRYRRQLPAQSLGPPQLCLELIASQGPEVAREFNGLFCIALHDRESRSLTLVSDRFAFRPLFYVRRAAAFVFATELKGVRCADPDLPRVDDVGLLELFCYGSHTQGRTWIEGYTRLAPATILRVDSQGVDIRRYWVYRYDEAAPRLDQPTYYTGFAKLMDRAVERSMRGSRRIGMFLSAGYDSRSVAAAIRPHHLPIPAFTFGDPEARDVRLAPLLAQRLGLEHHTLSRQEAHLYRWCEAIVWRTEGMVPFSSTTSIRFHSELKEKLDIILTGFLGEFSGSHTWPRLLLARSRAAAIRTIFERMTGPRLEAARRVFQPAFFARAFEQLRARFAASFEGVPNDHPLNVADVWNVTCLQPHGTYQAPAVDRHLFEVRAPHMDAELVSFLLTIPPWARLEQRVYKKMIAYSYPEVRGVPCANSNRPIEPRFVREYAKMVARFAGRKAVESLGAFGSRRSMLGREIHDLDHDFRAEPELGRELLQPMLRAGVFDPAVFHLAHIEEMLGAHYSGAGRHAATLATLISWGLAARYLLAGDVGAVPAALRGVA